MAYDNPPNPTAALYNSVISVGAPTTFEYHLNDLDVPGIPPSTPPVYDTINGWIMEKSDNLRATSDITISGDQATRSFEAQTPTGECWVDLGADDAGNPIDDGAGLFWGQADGEVY
jgi:hypothetical protein